MIHTHDLRHIKSEDLSFLKLLHSIDEKILKAVEVEENSITVTLANSDVEAVKAEVVFNGYIFKELENNQYKISWL